MSAEPQERPTKASMREWTDGVGLAVIDVLYTVLAFSAAYQLAFPGRDFSVWIFEHLNLVFIAAFLTVLNFYFFDLYYVSKDFRRYNQFINLIFALGLTFLALTITAFLDRSLLVGRMFLLFYFTLMLIFTVISRSGYSALAVRYHYNSALILGCNTMTAHLVDLLNDHEANGDPTGIKVIGYVSEAGCSKGDTDRGLPCLGTIDEIEELMRTFRPQIVVYGLGQPGGSKANELLIKEKLKGVNLISAEGLYEGIAGRIPFQYIGSGWLIEDCLRARKFTEVRVKRLFDIVLGTIFFLISLPVIAVCAVIVKLESKGPMFFVQERIGRFGRPFRIYKLRTMTVPGPCEARSAGGCINLYAESRGRLTRFGCFLRNSHFDELPQFFNVLKGEMSIVGPRPEMEMFIRMCEDRIPFYRLRLAVKPGITGWAQVWYWHTSTLSGYKRKFEYDLYYLANLSLRLDIEIMMRTVMRVVGLREEDSV